MVVHLVPLALVEIPILCDKTPFYPDIIVFSTNSFCTFALNLVVFLLVGKTSVLTINVIGVVKDWLLIDFSWSVSTTLSPPSISSAMGLPSSVLSTTTMPSCMPSKPRSCRGRRNKSMRSPGGSSDSETEGSSLAKIGFINSSDTNSRGFYFWI
ncbi:putative sugar phosphate/phosphate translocator [Canna indica]|uniref:Sugar phosphate/phosphate translocator n=1 Tax=Canna indica TaxID=4628 RepID=A0AAQ3QIU9_9LILI|nr:putative sugar phosphate/phosphate translocator [Canna indica]